MGRFTDEELEIAKSVDLVDLAGNIQIPLKSKGSYFYVDGMDSIMIFNRASWYRFSRGVGGSTIDFLMYFKEMEYNDAVSYLLDYAGYIKLDNPSIPSGNMGKGQSRKGGLKEKERVPFILPEKSKSCRGMYAYLIKRRKLSKEIIQHWIKEGLMYESVPHHNIVFLGRNAEDEVKFASQRGIRDVNGKSFKGDVPGNDKRYGVNLINHQNKEINVYEAAIDAMSDMDFRKDYETSILALGMVSDGPLQTVLKEQPHIKSIHFCLDNDLPGRVSAKKLARKYVLEGYEVYVRLPPFGKDYNAFLQCERENRTLWKQLNQSEIKRQRNIQEPKSAKFLEERILYLPNGISIKAENSRKEMQQRAALAR